VAFTSAHSHYTIKRSTWMMGMGLDAAINVCVDADGKMSPQALGSFSVRMLVCLTCAYPSCF
jgi:glutamate/tyrosine decarboxylase-like PLP-dependent enzyme